MNPSPSERRRAQRRAEARQEILAAAQQILVEEDHRELSMRKLGERSGYTAPTLYHYFGDKNGLIDALLESALGELVAEIRREMSGLDPLAGLGVLFESFAHFFLRQPAYYHLLTEPRPEGAPPPAVADAARRLIEEQLLRLAAQSRLKIGDLDVVQQSFWALLHGLVSLQTTRPKLAWSPALNEVALDAMIRGFVADPSEECEQ